MQSPPRRIPAPRLIAALLGALMTLAGGCASRTTHWTRPDPPCGDATETLRREQVASRARELVASGQYKNSNDAINAANRENPPAGGQPLAQWSTGYAQWERQKAKQEKFQSDFAKANQQQ